MAKSNTNLLLILLTLFASLLLVSSHSAAVNEATQPHPEHHPDGAKHADSLLWPFLHPHPHPHPHPFPWPFAHPPLPANFPKIQWPFVHPPMPANGFKWPPQWPFAHPPMPAGGKWPPHWPFVHPPMPAGGKLPPLPELKWPPQWPFVHPPMPSWWPHGMNPNGVHADAAAPPPKA